MITRENRAVVKGQYGEEQLLNWFQEYKIGFIPINQTPHTFAQAFANTIKRPDFLVLLPSIGVIAVDAKNYQCTRGCFTIGEEELKKALRFEMLTKMPFWFAYLYEDNAGNRIWCWINVIKAYRMGIKRRNGGTGSYFFSIDLAHFTHVSDGRNLGQIFFCLGV